MDGTMDEKRPVIPMPDIKGPVGIGENKPARKRKSRAAIEEVWVLGNHATADLHMAFTSEHDAQQAHEIAKAIDPEHAYLKRVPVWKP